MEPITERGELSKSNKIELLDFIPETLKTDVPVLLIPGWNGTPEIMEESIKGLVENGRRVLAVDFHGYAKDESSIVNSTIQLDRAEAILNALAEKKVKELDVVTHSSGSISAIYAIALAPKGNFRDIVLDKAAGSIGEDDIFSLSGRYGKALLTDLWSIIRRSKDKEKLARTLKLGSKNFRENLGSGIQEAITIVRGSEIFGLFKELREEKGIRIAIVAGIDDSVFPMKKQQEFVKAEVIDGFLSVKGRHEHTPGRVVEQLLTAMESNVQF